MGCCSPDPLGVGTAANDYTAIDTSDCFVVFAYPYRPPGAEHVHLYFRRFNICDAADVDGSGEVNAIDPGSFAAAYIAASAQADIDGNNTLNAAAFLAAYQASQGS